jgi:glycosyltransferase involved in cell wall biosynthesis
MYNIAIIWGKWGPYHYARFSALASVWNSCTGIALAGKSSNYAWAPVAQPLVHVLNPDLDQETLSPLKVAIQVFKFLKKERIRIAFLPSYWPARSLGILLASRLAGARCIMMNESHAGTEHAGGLGRWIKRILLRLFNAGLVGGTPQITHFTQLGMPADKLFKGYDTIDNEYFSSQAEIVRGRAASVRARYGLPGHYILNLGRMVEKKNLWLLVEAYAQLCARAAQGGPERGLGPGDPDAAAQPLAATWPGAAAHSAGPVRPGAAAHSAGPEPAAPLAAAPALVLIGSGPEEAALRALALERGLAVRDLEPGRPGPQAATVYFGGFRQIDENPAFYALADVFVLPSAWEEWGLVVNEAMACGLPVLVSREAGCALDLVKEGVNGHRFDPKDPGELSLLMERIVNDDDRRRAMGLASLEHICHWGCDLFAYNALRAAAAATNQSLLNLSSCSPSLSSRTTNPGTWNDA